MFSVGDAFSFWQSVAVWSSVSFACWFCSCALPWVWFPSVSYFFLMAALFLALARYFCICPRHQWFPRLGWKMHPKWMNSTVFPQLHPHWPMSWFSASEVLSESLVAVAWDWNKMSCSRVSSSIIERVLPHPAITFLTALAACVYTTACVYRVCD